MKVGVVLVFMIGLGFLFANTFSVKDGNVTVEIDSKEYNLTKNHEQKLASGSKICVKDGNGSVLVNDEVLLSKSLDNSCLELKKEEEFDFEAWLKKNMHKVALLFGDMKEQVKLAVNRKGKECEVVTGTLVLKPSDEYLVIRNECWSPLPIRLKVLDENNGTVESFVNESDDVSLFIVPREVLKDGYRILGYDGFGDILIDINIELVNINLLEIEKVCNEEMKKDKPILELSKVYCTQIGDFYKSKEDYIAASWYYLLSGELEKNIKEIKGNIQTNFSNIGHTYVLKKNFDKAKNIYQTFLKQAKVPWADKAIKEDYKLLFKLYPQQTDNLKKGLRLWNEIYSPLKPINMFYIKYQKANKNNQYKKSINYLTKIIELQKKYQNKKNISMWDNIFNLGVLYHDINHTKSLELYHQVEPIYKNIFDKRKDYLLLLEWIADNYKSLKENVKAIEYYKKSLKFKELEKDSRTSYLYDNIASLYFEIGKHDEFIKYSLKNGKYFEDEGNYILASKYYLLAKENYRNINSIEKLMKDNYSYSIGDSYLLQGNVENAKKIYINFLKSNYSLTSYESLENRFYFLMKLYPEKIDILNEGLKVWTKVYSPYSQLEESYRKYMEAEKNEDINESIKQLSSVVFLQEKYQKKDYLFWNNLFGLGIKFFHNSQYEKSIDIFLKIENKYELDSYNQVSYSLILQMLADSYNKLKNYKKSIQYTKKAIFMKEKVLKEELKDIKMINSFHLSLAKLYIRIKKYEEAKKMYVKIGDYLESQHNYEEASLYYLLGDYKKSINYIQKNMTKDYTIAIAGYILDGNFSEVRNIYKEHLKYLYIEERDQFVKDTYIKLLPLYPKKVKNIKKGLVIWNEMYSISNKMKQLKTSYTKANNNKDNKEAISYLTQLIKLQKRYQNKKHIDIIDNLYTLGILNLNNDNYNTSLEIFKKVEEVYKYEKNKLKSYSYLLNVMAYIYENLKNNSKSLVYYKKSLAIIKSIDTSQETLSIYYSDLVRIYTTMEKYEKVLFYNKLILGINRKLYGDESSQMAESHNALADTYFVLNFFPQALKNYKKSLDIRKRLFGEESVEVSNSYIDIGMYYHSRVNFSKSLNYFLKALKNSSSTKLAEIYYYISEQYIVQNNLQKAMEYTNKSLKEIKHIKIKTDKDFILLINYANLASIYNIIGDYQKSLEFYKKALLIAKVNFGENHTISAKLYNNLSLLYMNIQSFGKALKYIEKALDIYSEIFPNKHVGTLDSLIHLSYIHLEMKNYEKALQSIDKSFEYSISLLGEENKYYPSIHSIKAGILYKQDKSTSLEYSLKALDLSKKQFGKNSRLVGITNNAVGMNFFKNKDYSQALVYLTKSKDILEKDILIGKVYHNLAKVYDKKTNYYNGYFFQKKSLKSFFKEKGEVFLITSSQEKKTFLDSSDERISLFLSISNKYIHELEDNDQGVKQSVFDDWLNYKASIFDSENSIAMLYQNTKDQELKGKIETLTANQRTLADFYQNILRDEKEWEEKIKLKEKRVANLTNEIAQKSLIFQEQQNLKSINHKAITKNLKTNELYIDYARAGDYYYIFTLDNQNQIDFIQIDEKSTKKIDALIMSFRGEINNLVDGKKPPNSKEKLSLLYNLLIKEPLNEKLKNKTSLIISPDGALRLLPFEALYDKEHNKYLIQSKEICYIPSGKEFVRLHKYAKKRVSTNNTITVFANPNFDSNQSASFHKEQIALTRGTNENIIKPFFKELYKPLLGTEAEAKAIDKIMDNVEIFEDNRANESNLLAVKEPKILHIATHGFFINTPNIPNPMLKSGIVLSGVNHHAKRKQGYGRVTALKLSGLNLRSTDLVVLSACETGVVDVNDTDSISGLGKAFIQAGAKDVVMSLWSVDDNATKELMIDFYRGIKEHSNYSRALREAKLKMIDEGQHPFYWGGFVLNGL